MRVLGRIQTLPEKVTQVAEADEPEVGDIRREQNIIRRFLHRVVQRRWVAAVTGHVPVRGVRAVPELGVHGDEGLGRRRGVERDHEPCAVVDLPVLVLHSTPMARGFLMIGRARVGRGGERRGEGERRRRGGRRALVEFARLGVRLGERS